MGKQASLALIAASLLAAACDGLYSANGGGNGLDGGSGPDPKALAKANFDLNVRPFMQNTCFACHGTGAANTPQFLGGANFYDTLMGSVGMVVPGNPDGSRLIIWGSNAAHTGPKLLPEQITAIRNWINLEPGPLVPDAGVGTNANTALMMPAAGANMVDLSKLNPALTGAQMTFDYTGLSGGMFFSKLTIKAGAMAIHVFHPLFVYYPMPTDPHPDPVDSFYNLDIQVPANGTVVVGGGTVILTNTPANSQLSVRFEKLEMGSGVGMDGGTLAGGCKDVPTFTANAKPALMVAQPGVAQSCSSCHAGGDPGATSGFDLRSLADTTPAGQAAACGQVKGKINLGNPQLSILFQRPKPPQTTNHKFTFPDTTTYTNFLNALNVWVAKEQ